MPHGKVGGAWEADPILLPASRALSTQGSLSGLPFLSSAHTHTLFRIFRDQSQGPVCWEDFPLQQLEAMAAYSHPLVLLSPMALISVDPEDSPSLDGPRVSPLTWHSSAGVPYSFAE